MDVRGAVLTAALAGVAVLAVGASGAIAGTGPGPDAIIKAKGSGGNLHFAKRVTEIPSGGSLKVVNRTNDDHTFSIVTRAEVPDTNREIRHCFDKPTAEHICRLVYKAHKIPKAEGGGFHRLVNNGDPGLDTAFELPDTFGDSFILFNRPRTIDVSANPNSTLWYMCIIHPWMHGKIEVTAPSP